MSEREEKIFLLVLKCVGYCDDVQNMIFGFLITPVFSCLKMKGCTEKMVPKKKPHNIRFKCLNT